MTYKIQISLFVFESLCKTRSRGLYKSLMQMGWGALENTFRIDGTWPTSCKTPCVCFFFNCVWGIFASFLTAWFAFFRKWEVKAIHLNSYPHAFTPVYQHAQERQRDDNRNHNRCKKWLAIVTYTIKKFWFSSYCLSNRKLQVWIFTAIDWWHDCNSLAVLKGYFAQKCK